MYLLCGIILMSDDSADILAEVMLLHGAAQVRNRMFCYTRLVFWRPLADPLRLGRTNRGCSEGSLLLLYCITQQGIIFSSVRRAALRSSASFGDKS